MQSNIHTVAYCLMPVAYLINLVARANRFGSMVTPICLAVFRLITNSNLIGCSTGNSEGLVPFKILCCSTSTAIGSLTQSPQSVFGEHSLTGRRARKVHLAAPCLSQRIPARNRSQLVPPKAEQSTAARAPRLGE